MSAKDVKLALGLSLIICFASSCAGPQLQVPRASQQGVDTERQRQLGLLQDQRDVAFRTRIEEWRRVFGVYSRLRIAGAELCKADVKPFWGMWFVDESVFPTEDRSRAKRFLGVDHRVSLLAVSPRAASLGFRAGDIVTKIDGVTLEPITWPSQGNYLQRASEVLTKAGTRSVTIEILRAENRYSAVLAPEPGCRYTLNIRPDGQINAGATGDIIIINSGILSLANNDDELAHVIGHELAHNALGHIDRQKSNEAVGAILGAIVDIGLAVGGVNSQGALTKLGADSGRKAYSQDFEREADYMSLYFMIRAGFDVTKAADVQRKLGIVSPGSLYSNYASTHPSSPERAANLDIALQEVSGKVARSESLVPTNLGNSSNKETVLVADSQKVLEQSAKPPVEIQSIAQDKNPQTPTTTAALTGLSPTPLAPVPQPKPVVKTYASLVQYDGPVVKSGVTLDAQFIDDGSGSGDAVVSDIANRELRGTFTTIMPGATDWPRPKFLDRPTLNKLQIQSDKPWVMSTVSNNDTVLECVFGETRPLGLKKGACRDNHGNRYHVNLVP